MNKPKVFIYTPVDKSGGSHKQLEAAGCELKLSDISWHKLTGDMDIIEEVEESTAALLGVAVRKIPDHARYNVKIPRFTDHCKIYGRH